MMKPASDPSDDVTTYGKWTIYYDPPPIPDRSCDFHFYHDDYDGAEDANDNRCGHGSSIEDCMKQIDDLEFVPDDAPIPDSHAGGDGS
jgi:hypothetical protein